MDTANGNGIFPGKNNTPDKMRNGSVHTFAVGCIAVKRVLLQRMLSVIAQCSAILLTRESALSSWVGYTFAAAYICKTLYHYCHSSWIYFFTFPFIVDEWKAISWKREVCFDFKGSHLGHPIPGLLNNPKE